MYEQYRELAKKLMDYDNCHDGVIDAAANAINDLIHQVEYLQSKLRHSKQNEDDLFRNIHGKKFDL